MYVQPLEGSLASPLSSLSGNSQQGTLTAGGALTAPGDNISRFVPPWPGNGSAADAYGETPYGSSSMQGLFGPLMGMLSQLMQMLQSLMGYGGSTSPFGSNGGCPPNGNGSCAPNGNEQFFQNATGGSQGDPHLSFNGDRWKSMASQPDLLNSDSFAGGYQISTQSTPQNAKGVSWNQSATISMNGGGTTVSLNNQGDASITRYGQSVSIARGQTMQLGDGESVKCNQDGSLLVTARNGNGGEISTTLSAKGNGVDVDVTAHDVDLGGTLVNSSQMQPSPGPSPDPGFPQPNPLPNPVGWPGPFGEPYGFSPPTSPTPPVAYPDY